MGAGKPVELKMGVTIRVAIRIFFLVHTLHTMVTVLRLIVTLCVIIGRTYAHWTEHLTRICRNSPLMTNHMLWRLETSESEGSRVQVFNPQKTSCMPLAQPFKHGRIHNRGFMPMLNAAVKRPQVITS